MCKRRWLCPCSNGVISLEVESISTIRFAHGLWTNDIGQVGWSCSKLKREAKKAFPQWVPSSTISHIFLATIIVGFLLPFFTVACCSNYLHMKKKKKQVIFFPSLKIDCIKELVSDDYQFTWVFYQHNAQSDIYQHKHLVLLLLLYNNEYTTTKVELEKYNFQRANLCHLDEIITFVFRSLEGPSVHFNFSKPWGKEQVPTLQIWECMSKLNLMILVGVGVVGGGGGGGGGLHNTWRAA